MQSRMTLDIDRKIASRLLGVSVRTVDRYIRSGKLPAREVNGRVWLSKSSIEKLKQPKSFPRESSRLATMDRRASVSTPAVKRVPVSTHAARATKTAPADFYKDLYDEARTTVTDYHKKLEQAQYRIGQLESQPQDVSQETPLTVQTVRKELYEREHEITLLKESLNKEKTNRIIFAVLTYGLLILQPIFWYLMR